MQRLGTLLLGLTLAAWAGCSGGGGAAGTGATTKGRVLFRNREPPSSASVRVTGCAQQWTAADGSFDTTCAAETYDVAVSYANVGLLYRGLTRRDPVVTLPFALGAPQGGSASGAASGLTAGRAAAVALTSAGISDGFTPTPDGTFSDYVDWFGAPPAATVRVLEWTPATGLPTAFTGYVGAAVALKDGSDVTSSPALAAVASGGITMSSSAPDSAGLTYGLWATWPDGGVTEITSAAPASTGVTVATPDVPGVAFAVVAERGANPTAWGWRRGLAATSAPGEISLPTAPVFTAPAPGATVDASTAFTFGALADAAYLVAFESSSGTPLLYVVTSETTVHLPDFSWAGLTLPVATGLTARVFAFGPCASVDDAAAATDPLTLLPTTWAAANRIPEVDGFASRHTMSVTTR